MEKGESNIDRAISHFKRLEEKMNIKRVHNIKEAIDWMNRNMGEYVLCVNGKKTKVAKCINDCEIFYSDCK